MKSHQILSLLKETLPKKMLDFLVDNSIRFWVSEDESSYVINFKKDYKKDYNSSNSENVEITNFLMGDFSMKYNFRVSAQDFRVIKKCEFDLSDENNQKNNQRLKLVTAICKNIELVLPDIVSLNIKEKIDEEEIAKTKFYEKKILQSNSGILNFDYILVSLYEQEGETVHKRVGKDSKFESYKGSSFSIDKSHYKNLTEERIKLLNLVQDFYDTFTEYESVSDYYYSGGKDKHFERSTNLIYPSKRITHFVRRCYKQGDAEQNFALVKESMLKDDSHPRVGYSLYPFTRHIFAIKSLIFIYFNKDLNEVQHDKIFFIKLLPFVSSTKKYQLSSEHENIFQDKNFNDGIDCLFSFYWGNKSVINKFFSAKYPLLSDHFINQIIFFHDSDFKTLNLPYLLSCFSIIENN